MFEGVSREVLAGGVFLAVACGAYLLTNFRAVAGAVLTRLAALKPATSPADPAVDAPVADLEAVLATVRAVKVRALDRPAEVRSAALAECDKFEATVRALYSSELPLGSGAAAPMQPPVAGGPAA